MKAGRKLSEEKRDFRKIHVYLNVVLLVSFVVSFLFSVSNASGEASILMAILFMFAVIFITGYMFFGLYALVHHVTKSSGFAYVFMSFMDASWMVFFALGALVQVRVIFIFVVAFVFLSQLFVTVYLLAKRDWEVQEVSKRGMASKMLGNKNSGSNQGRYHEN